MATIAHVPTNPLDAAPAGESQRPTLEAGDYLSRADFERRYDARSDIRKAELIEGIVYMPSVARYSKHGRPTSIVNYWLADYALATPGVETADNCSVRLDLDNEPQPDALLRITPQCGGQSRTSADDFIEGAPELIVEVAASSASYDMHSKMTVYRRNGVREYVVVLTDDRRIRWFTLRDTEFVESPPDDAGVFRSGIFPGLWLDGRALLDGDAARVKSVLHQGLATSEHAASVEKLATILKSKR